MKTYCQVSQCGFEKKARQCLCVGGFWQKIIITTSKLCVWIFMEDWGRGGKCEERQQREIFCHPRSCVTTATCGLFCNYAQFWRKIPKIHHKIMHLILVIVASSTAASLGDKGTDFVNRLVFGSYLVSLLTRQEATQCSSPARFCWRNSLLVYASPGTAGCAATEASCRVVKQHSLSWTSRIEDKRIKSLVSSVWWALR